MDRLIRNALPGLSLRHAEAACWYPEVRQQVLRHLPHGGLWDGVAVRNVSVYVPSEIGDPKMEVLILLEDKS
jgi:hypothetical protein